MCQIEQGGLFGENGGLSLGMTQAGGEPSLQQAQQAKPEQRACDHDEDRNGHDSASFLKGSLVTQEWWAERTRPVVPTDNGSWCSTSRWLALVG